MKSGSQSKNMTSDSVPEIAKYSQKYYASVTISGVCVSIAAGFSHIMSRRPNLWGSFFACCMPFYIAHAAKWANSVKAVITLNYF